MYELADRPPPVGSLREALFLTVWLRRQDAEVNRMRVMTAGFTDVLVGKDNGLSREAFRIFYESMYPYAEKAKVIGDEEMKAFMKREVDKGILRLTPLETNPLKDAAKRMQVPDEFKQKLQQKALAARGKK